jgi:purine-binding chemotaxis protein CheW
MNTRQSINWNSVKRRLEESQASLGQNLPGIEGEPLQQVYRERARQFATCPLAAVARSDARRVLTFTVKTERLCLDLALVAEILPNVKCSPIPGASPQLLGVINVRGRICSVLDLARILELPEAGLGERGYIVMVRHAGIQVGLRVDKVDQIEVVTRDELEGRDRQLGTLSAQYVKSRTASRVAVLNLEAVFSHPVFSPSLQARGTTSFGLNIERLATRVAAASLS